MRATEAGVAVSGSIPHVGFAKAIVKCGSYPAMRRRTRKKSTMPNRIPEVDVLRTHLENVLETSRTRERGLMVEFWRVSLALEDALNDNAHLRGVIAERHPELDIESLGAPPKRAVCRPKESARRVIRQLEATRG